MTEDDDIAELLGDLPAAKINGDVPEGATPSSLRINGALAAVSPKGGKKEPQIRVGRLDSLEHIGAEAAKLYRKARQSAGGELNAMTASRLASVLKLCADVVQAASLARFEEIEARLAELEDGRRRK